MLKKQKSIQFTNESKKDNKTTTNLSKIDRIKSTLTRKSDFSQRSILPLDNQISQRSSIETILTIKEVDKTNLLSIIQAKMLEINKLCIKNKELSRHYNNKNSICNNEYNQLGGNKFYIKEDDNISII